MVVYDLSHLTVYTTPGPIYFSGTNMLKAGVCAALLAALTAPCDAFQAASPRFLAGSKVRAVSAAPVLRAGASNTLAPMLSSTRRPNSGAAGLACLGDAGAFKAWLSESGASVSCSPRVGGGLTADKKLKEGEEACSIPTKICMTEESALKALGPKAEDLDAETQIALQLIYERARGSSSSYAPWLAMIPDREGLEMPLFWSAAEKRMLEGSSVLDDTEELADALADEFRQVALCSIPYVRAHLPVRMSKVSANYTDNLNASTRTPPWFLVKSHDTVHVRA